MSRVCPATLFLVTLTLLACTGDPKPSAASVNSLVGDTVVVQNGAADIELPWQLTPSWVAGGADTGALSFTRVAPGLVGVANDGRLRVLDPSAHRIVILDAKGHVAGTLGRKGRGPGELEFPIAMTVEPSGAISVLDATKFGTVRFAGDGRVLPPVTMPRNPIPNGAMKFLGDSVVYDFRVMEGSQAAGDWRLGLIVMSAGDTTVVTTVPFPVREPRDVNYGCHADRGAWPLFVPAFRWAIGAGRLAWTEAGEYRIVVRDANGTTVITRAIPPTPTTVAMARRAFPGGRTFRAASGPCEVSPETLVEQNGMHPSLPVIASLLVDPTGALWVRRWTFPDEPSRSDVFSAAGVYLGTLTGWGPPVAFLGDSGVFFAERDTVTDVRRVRFARLDR